MVVEDKSLRRSAQDDSGKLCGLIEAGYQGRRPLKLALVLKLAPEFLYTDTLCLLTLFRYSLKSCPLQTYLLDRRYIRAIRGRVFFY